MPSDLGMVALALVGMFPSACALDNGFRTPVLGWSSWNWFRNDINETLVLAVADGIVSSGLAAAGYKYINLDAGVWLPNRSNQGELVADPAKFPSGVASLASKLHGMGLKLGMYTDLSNREVGYVCGTGPGSYGHYAKDASTFAELQVDFLKVGIPTNYVTKIVDSAFYSRWYDLDLVGSHPDSGCNQGVTRE